MAWSPVARLLSAALRMTTLVWAVNLRGAPLVAGNWMVRTSEVISMNSLVETERLATALLDGDGLASNHSGWPASVRGSFIAADRSARTILFLRSKINS